MGSPTLRVEVPSDVPAIYSLVKEAFAPMPFCDGNEQDALNNMRDNGDLILSLVAEDSGEIIGQVAFSPAELPCDGRWAALGPIAVRGDRQKQGIGSNLAKMGLDWLKDQGFDGCVLLGNPKVYGPMGFRAGGLTFLDLPSEIVQWIAFGDLIPKGEVTFSKALEPE